MLKCLDFLRWAVLSALAAECFSLGILGGVRRRLIFAGEKALASARGAALLIWCASGTMTFFLRGWFPAAFLFAVGPCFLLLRLMIDMRGYAGRVGRVNVSAIRELWISSRAHRFALFFGAVPIGCAFFMDARLFPIGFFCVFFLFWAARRGRLDDHGSEKRVALSAVLLCLPLMFAPAVVLSLSLPRYALLIPAWAVSVSYICGLSEGRFRYGIASSAFMFLCALTPFLQAVPGSALSASFACLLLYFLRPCIYGLMIGVRARQRNRRVHAHR